MKKRMTNEIRFIRARCSAFMQKYDVPFVFKFSFVALPSAEITLKENRFVSSSIVNVSDECRDIIINLAKSKGVVLSWNNTGSTFWIKRHL